ncbi:hypothetical protein K435DRAFT_810302 [Dendrothele bispora CBS 962.96]|uniref:Uncharacterized protein n=1 Tax=Dendrothele bispora (strain CBS 962.96) TaxID=1314807 RepID=A0A4S8KVI7_DENBC|nr:hypothetical protein K435DRAFT_810302 [Dendrothele bispora CBS 962.96]
MTVVKTETVIIWVTVTSKKRGLLGTGRSDKRRVPVALDEVSIMTHNPLTQIFWQYIFVNAYPVPFTGWPGLGQSINSDGKPTANVTSQPRTIPGLFCVRKAIGEAWTSLSDCLLLMVNIKNTFFWKRSTIIPFAVTNTSGRVWVQPLRWWVTGRSEQAPLAGTGKSFIESASTTQTNKRAKQNRPITKGLGTNL